MGTSRIRAWGKVTGGENGSESAEGGPAPRHSLESPAEGLVTEIGTAGYSEGVSTPTLLQYGEPVFDL